MRSTLRPDAALQGHAVPEYLVKVLRSFMQSRKLVMSEGVCLPGSVLGPTLWNLFYDGVLRLPVHDGIRLVAFADDVAVVDAARNAQIIELLANYTLADIVDWMSNNGLQLAPEKSECVVLTKKYAYRDPELYIQGCLVPVRRSVRYLGVHLDMRLSFGEHVVTVAFGARKAVAALGKLMPNVGGPSQCKRSLLMSVVHSRLLYCAPVWADGVQPVQKYKNMLLQTQRCAALRVVRCYRTVSDMAALALARMPPAFLQASARKSAVEARKAGAARTKHEIVEDIISKWQWLWDSTTTKAAWTKRLIPSLWRWCFHGPKEVSFHMAQVLMGHGCFQQYLWSINRILRPVCLLCPADSDDAEHTLFDCMFWIGERRKLEESLGRPARPEDVQNILYGVVPSELPEDLQTKRRIVSAANRRRELFIQMVEDIMGQKVG